MDNYYITIGRQHGCGGRIVGKKLADRLGIGYYDRDSIVELISAETGLAKDTVSGLMEHRTSSLLYEMATLANTNPLEEQVFIAKTKIINELADKESFVIVGSCADYILRDRENILKVFLYGTPEERLNRIINEYGEVPYMSEQQLKSLDRNRADYYRFFTSYKWGTRNHYDLLLNTDLGLENIEDMLTLIAKQRFKGE